MKYKILVVDDEKDSCLSLDVLLSWEGHKVTTATSGSLALNKIKEGNEINEPFDILITDLAMPNMDGFDLINKIDEMNLRIIIISACVKKNKIQKFCNEKGLIFVEKPINKDEILIAINTINNISLDNNLNNTDIMNFMGILYNCPFNKALESCPLKNYRKDMTSLERMRWGIKLPIKEKNKILSKHESCACKRFEIHNILEDL